MVKCGQYLAHAPLAIRMSTWSICSQHWIKQPFVTHPLLHLLLPVCMYTGGGRLPVGLSCKHAMPWWASSHLAVRWECRPLPLHTGKIYFEICSDSMHIGSQFNAHRVSRLICILHKCIIRPYKLKLRYNWASGILMICWIVVKKVAFSHL